MLSDRKRPPANVILPEMASTITERNSTKPPVPAAHLIHKGLEYIVAHEAEPITVTDVVKHLGVSRRLVELRFSELHGGNISATIKNHRLERARRMLTDTKLGIGHIAAACGFPSRRSAELLFKSHFRRTAPFLPSVPPPLYKCGGSRIPPSPTTFQRTEHSRKPYAQQGLVLLPWPHSRRTFAPILHPLFFHPYLKPAGVRNESFTFTLANHHRPAAYEIYSQLHISRSILKPWGHTPRNHCKTRLRARTLPPCASPTPPASGGTTRNIHPPPHLQRSDLPTKFCA